MGVSWRIQLAISQGCVMRICWIFAASYSLDPAIDAETVKSVGATWGSWKTWRSCSTDNVICDDLAKNRELLKRAFQAVCNFWVPRRSYQDLARPMGVKFYDGNFDLEMQDIEDVIAMHLVSRSSDIVLLVGFYLSRPDPVEDRFEKHKIQNRLGSIRSVINDNPAVQWVLIDHERELDLAFQTLPNLTCDSMQNALQLLV